MKLTKEPARKNALELTSRSFNTKYREEAVRGIEIQPFSGQVGYFEVTWVTGRGPEAIGLAVHSIDGPTKKHFLKWNSEGYIESSIIGIDSFESSDLCYLKHYDCRTIGIMVDCRTNPFVWFCRNGMLVHQQLIAVAGHGKFIFPMFCPLNCTIEISENPNLPLDWSSPRPFPLWAVRASVSEGGWAAGQVRNYSYRHEGGMRAGDRCWASFCLPVLDNMSGEERGRMFINPEDTVQAGQLQFEAQTGVSVSSQRMFLGDLQLDGRMKWGNFQSLGNGTPIRIEVVLQKVLLAFYAII